MYKFTCSKFESLILTVELTQLPPPPLYFRNFIHQMFVDSITFSMIRFGIWWYLSVFCYFFMYDFFSQNWYPFFNYQDPSSLFINFLDYAGILPSFWYCHHNLFFEFQITQCCFYSNSQAMYNVSFLFSSGKTFFIVYVMETLFNFFFPSLSWMWGSCLKSWVYIDL